MSESFAPALKDLMGAGTPVAQQPTGGMGVALDAKGRLPYSTLPLIDFVNVFPASGTLTLTTALQDVAGCTVDLDPGSYIVVGVFDFAHTVNGGGLAVGSLNVGGSVQTNEAHLLNTGSANGDRATVPAVWVFTITAKQTVKLQASKSINAGTAQAVITHTTLSYLRYA